MGGDAVAVAPGEQVAGSEEVAADVSWWRLRNVSGADGGLVVRAFEVVLGSSAGCMGAGADDWLVALADVGVGNDTANPHTLSVMEP